MANIQLHLKNGLIGSIKPLLLTTPDGYVKSVKDIEAQATNEIESTQQFLPPERSENLDWASVRASIIKRSTWLNNQYTEVVKEYSTNEIRHEFILDNRVSKLWELYETTVRPNPNINEPLNTPNNYTKSGYDFIHKIYLVNYPQVVQYSIDISTIIGIPKEPGFNI